MGKDIWKPGTVIYPVPAVMVSCGTMEQKNIITVAWTGTVNSDPAMTYVSIRPSRHSYNIIKETGEFVINLVTERLVYACDFCGVRSGRDLDKFEAMHLTAKKGEKVNAPIIYESPVNIVQNQTTTRIARIKDKKKKSAPSAIPSAKKRKPNPSKNPKKSLQRAKRKNHP